MVTFTCDRCNETFKKNKIQGHINGQCRGATATCIDCLKSFSGAALDKHTSCISEEQKYQGNMYKQKKDKQQKTQKSANVPKAEQEQKQDQISSDKEQQQVETIDTDQQNESNKRSIFDEAIDSINFNWKTSAKKIIKHEGPLDSIQLNEKVSNQFFIEVRKQTSEIVESRISKALSKIKRLELKEGKYQLRAKAKK
ncbi:MAG: hypothetical protein EZS28_017777 [Streblomastix strix]|uniref:Zinc finger C2H2 LYAR-type domain-containing protein n=1 Tax=Streblomastix strix TaxID=222440 RepID=A0A5J4VX16_9EUKA|nr:MAG: hypothetical protein EZS28_017777 [Streblomastix strix]